MIAVASVLAARGLALAFWLSAAIGLNVLLYAILGLGYLLRLRHNTRDGVFARALLNLYPLVVGTEVMRFPWSLGFPAFWGS